MDASDREMFRRDAALQCLLVFLDDPGEFGRTDKERKVAAAVEYATLLTAKLDQTEAGR